MKCAVLLSGPTSGLGNELLQQLGGLDHQLILVGRKLERLAEPIQQASAPIRTIEFDLALTVLPGIADELEQAVFDALQESRPDLLIFVNNAGVIEPIGRIGSFRPSQLVESMAVNLIAPMAIASACQKYARGCLSRIIVLNVSSGAAMRAIPGWSAYCSTKAAARMYFDVLASEEEARVAVHQFDPGVLDTQMQEKIRASSAGQFPMVEQFVRLKKDSLLKAPADVARQVVAQIKGWIE